MKLDTDRKLAIMGLIVIVIAFVALRYDYSETVVDSIPFPDGMVTDHDGMVPNQAEEQVERMITNYEHSIYVFVQNDTVKNIEVYAPQVFTKWRLGEADTLLVITPNDAYVVGDKGGLNQESREEIVDFAVRPYVVEQNYAEAVRTGVFSINETIYAKE